MQIQTRKHPGENNSLADNKDDEPVDWRSAFTDLIDKFSEAGQHFEVLGYGKA